MSDSNTNNIFFYSSMGILAIFFIVVTIIIIHFSYYDTQNSDYTDENENYKSYLNVTKDINKEYNRFKSS